MTAVPMPEPSFTLVSKMGDFISFRAKGFNHKKGDALYTADLLRAYGDARAKEALERAEAACDRIVTAYQEIHKGATLGERYGPHAEGCRQGAYDAAEAVRALMKEHGNG